MVKSVATLISNKDANYTAPYHNKRTTEQMIEPKTSVPAGLMLTTPLFSAVAMDYQHSERELQLLLLPATSRRPRDAAFFHAPRPAPASLSDHPQLDLSLSMSIGPPPLPRHSTDQKIKSAAAGAGAGAGARAARAVVAAAAGDVQALKRQTTEQSRLASAERAYAERVMEMARREVELAEREFARARAIWERARVEVEKVERFKEEVAAARRIGSAALEITCHACMQRFHP